MKEKYLHVPEDNQPASAKPNKKPKGPDFNPETHQIGIISNLVLPKEPASKWKELLINGGKVNIHESEEPYLHLTYFKCHYENAWYTKCYHPEHYDEYGNRIGPNEEKNRFRCASTGYFYPKDKGIEVPDPDNHPDGKMLVSKDDLNNNYRICDFSKKYYNSCHIIKILNSKALKRVCILYINKENDLFFCQKCNCAGHSDHVHQRDDLAKQYQGCFYCDKCYSSLMKVGIINAYNHNTYPKPSLSTRFRMGAEKLLGKWMATMAKEPVENPRLYGVELEVELGLNQCVKAKVDRFNLAIEILQALGKDFIMIKEDGSLLMNGHYGNAAKDPAMNKPTGPTYAGFEVVTGPSHLSVHYERWPKIQEIKHFKALRAWDTETCAMHVHVSKESLTNLTIGKIIRLVNCESNRKFIQKVAGRSSRKYSNYANQKISDVLFPNRVVSPNEQSSHDKARRVPINISNPNTIEFRIFRGTVNPRHILRNLEFCDAICDFCWPGNSSLGDVDNFTNFTKFVDQNRKKWPLLAEWLALWDYIPRRGVKDFVNPHALTVLPERVVEGEDKLDGNYIVSEPEVLTPDAKKDIQKVLSKLDEI